MLEDRLELLINCTNDIEEMERKKRALEMALKTARLLENDLRENVVKEMLDTGTLRADYSCFQFSLVNYPPRPFVADESLVPEEYIITKRTVDKKAINEAVKDGKSIAGVQLDNGSHALQMRVKQ